MDLSTTLEDKAPRLSMEWRQALDFPDGGYRVNGLSRPKEMETGMRFNGGVDWNEQRDPIGPVELFHLEELCGLMHRLRKLAEKIVNRDRRVSDSELAEWLALANAGSHIGEIVASEFGVPRWVPSR